MIWLISQILIQIYWKLIKSRTKILLQLLHWTNPLHLIIDEVEGHSEEKNGNKYLILDSTYKNKEVLIKYAKLWDGIKNSMEKVSNKLGEYQKDFIKIRFNFDINLPLNKTLKLHNTTTIIRSVFEEDGKCYP